MRQHSKKLAAGAFAAALALAACQGGDLANNSNSGPQLAVQPPTTGNGVANHEEFELCKTGSSATFNYSVTNYSGAGKTGGTTNTSSITLTAGQCKVIALFGGFGADVTVTETSAQTGFHLDHVNLTTIVGGVTSGPTSSAGPSVSAFISGSNGGALRGALATFVNVANPPPAEGCTPGYWKQDQHFDSWPAGYAPSDLFDTYFEDAFPGRSLLYVLNLTGGGLNALGRHTVAALLNAASGGVDYQFTVSEVISGFNGVFPGGDYEGQKNIFGVANEKGCPLN